MTKENEFVFHELLLLIMIIEFSCLILTISFISTTCFASGLAVLLNCEEKRETQVQGGDGDL